VARSQETSDKGQQYYVTICYPLLACDWLQSELPSMTLSGYISCQNPFSASTSWLRAFDFQK